MTADDILAYLASTPRNQRPVPLRSDSQMLRAWLALRNDRTFVADVIHRHGVCDDVELLNEHAIANAWALAREAVT